MWSCNDSTFLFNGYLDIGNIQIWTCNKSVFDNEISGNIQIQTDI